MSGKKREAKTIQVFFRLRPPNGGEKERKENCNVVKLEKDQQTVILGENTNPYNFTKTFGGDSKQTDVFDNVARKAVEDAFDGFHGLMFVYGQTGTGKTFTMSNQTKGQEGMLQRCVDLVFNKIKDDKSGDYEVNCTFIQIYQEVIEDLLRDKHDPVDKKGIMIRDDPNIEGGVYLSPVKQLNCYNSGSTAQEGITNSLKMFHKGDSNRSVGSTAMNAVSSRSHTVFTLYITRRNKMTEEDYDDDTANKEEFNGRLILVDLAGCERQKKTGAGGERLTEANAINGSLLVLGKCIKALTDPRQFVPYRESKLTRILQYSLAGHGKTTIVITAGPSERNMDETRSAIEFGQRAMTIKQQAKKHVEIDYKALCKKLQAQLDSRGDVLNEQLKEEIKVDFEEQLNQKDERIKFLEAELSLYKTGGGSPVPGGQDSDEDGEPAARGGGYSSSKPAAGGGAAPSGAGGLTVPSGGLASKMSFTGMSSAGKEKYRQQMKGLEEKLDTKGHEISSLKKEKLELAREKNDLDARLQQKTYNMNILAMKLQGDLRSKEEQLQKMQTALLKLQKGDYVSPTAKLDADDTDSSPRPDGMQDSDYIQKLQFAIRKMREREAMMTSYHEKAREAIMYQANKAEDLKEKLNRESEKRRKVEDKYDKLKGRDR
eukprot:TRINITY_DN449_c0_g4_i1.p1 TRINITY_DN449_c0_g4~~TRINITY_DN449_c0_g4_i1.p1  ORF type:complete len:657 (+),score=258.98 TRINITY_DN449_c0_g4_i1:56-2026(+)